MNTFFGLMIGHVPMQLISIGGFISLCYNWRSMNRTAAIMVLAALAANQLVFVANAFLAYWTHSQIELGTPSVNEVARLRFMFALPQILLSAVAWGLLFGAVFAAVRSPKDRSSESL